jgi:hypothetical protein
VCRNASRLQTGKIRLTLFLAKGILQASSKKRGPGLTARFQFPAKGRVFMTRFYPASPGEIMTDTCKQTSQANPADLAGNHDNYRQHAPTHEDFDWVEGIAQGSPYANFLETTLDIAAGIHVSLQIAYASDLERAANGDADADATRAPAVGIVEADQLLRLAMAASGLLRDEARRRVEVLND